MRTLIYKRTHVGDPSPEGVFGVHNCMGRVRRWSFDAVIGIGGSGAEPRLHGIARKINWIGIGAHKHYPSGSSPGEPEVTFDHFVLLEDSGPEVALLAPG